jgi:hypothetical protein
MTMIFVSRQRSIHANPFGFPTELMQWCHDNPEVR